MKAARIHEYTDEPGGAFSIEGVDPPTISEPDDVIVDVEAAGWCHTDNHIIEGALSEMQADLLPYTPGHENAGVVAEVGDAVTAVSPGDRVVVHPAIPCGRCRACRSGEDMHCPEHVFVGLDTDGGFAEQLLTKERSVIELDTLDPLEAAPHADAGITAYRAVKKAAADLTPVDYTVIFGIGGLGHIGLQALHAISATKTIAVDVKDEALDLAASHGSSHTIHARESDVPARIEEITDGTGVRKIIDFVGNEETFEYAPAIIQTGADHHVVGYEGNLNLPAAAMIPTELDFRGTLVGSYTELQELIELAERGEVTVNYSTYDLEEINAIAQRLHDGDIEGRAVFTP